MVVVFLGTCTNDGTGEKNCFDFTVDGVRQGGDDGIIQEQEADSDFAISFAYLVTDLAAGTHTVNLQWKTSGGTLTMYAGAGTASFDLHPSIYAFEI